MESHHKKKSRLVNYIEDKYENTPAQYISKGKHPLDADTPTIIEIRTDYPAIFPLGLEFIEETLNQMMNEDNVIEIMQSFDEKDSSSGAVTRKYKIEVYDGFLKYADGIRHEGGLKENIALRLELDDRKIPYMTGIGLSHMKYKIFKSDSNKWIKYLFQGLIEHTKKIKSLIPYEMKTYDPDVFMKESEGPDWATMTTEKKEAFLKTYLPDEIDEHAKPFFKEMYHYFIEQNKIGTFNFRLAITSDEIKKMKMKIGEDAYRMLEVKALQDAEFSI